MYETIPDQLKALNQWVCVWNDSKIPMQPLTFQAASSSDFRTWGTFQMASQAVADGAYDGIGFVFALNGIIGIDIDDGFDSDGMMTDKAIDIISKCSSYTEVSRSGRGFHILTLGKLPFNGKNNRDGVEIYQTGRYFILTGKTLEGLTTLTHAQTAIDYVVDRYFPEDRQTSSDSARGPKTYLTGWKKGADGRISLTREYPEIKPGSRNLCLTSLAGALKNYGYNRKELYKQLRRCNSAACNPPLDDTEVRSIVSSVMRYAD